MSGRRLREELLKTEISRKNIFWLITKLKLKQKWKMSTMSKKTELGLLVFFCDGSKHDGGGGCVLIVSQLRKYA